MVEFIKLDSDFMEGVYCTCFDDQKIPKFLQLKRSKIIALR